MTASAICKNEMEIYVLDILGGHFLLDRLQARHPEDIIGQNLYNFWKSFFVDLIKAAYVHNITGKHFWCSSSIFVKVANLLELTTMRS